MTSSSPDLVDLAPALREAFLTVGYDADTLLALLGSAAHDALGRGEPVPVRRASRDAGPLGVLVRALLLGDTCERRELESALPGVPLDRAVEAGLFEAAGAGFRAALDMRPMDLGDGNRWMFSDLDSSMRRRETTFEHVLGVGHASLSLLRATPTAPAGDVLDLGTGCGVQAVHASSFARTVTGTDVSERALRCAAASCAVNGVDVELLAGSWFEPVAGRRFDRIVANPPFVVGPDRVEHTYRDSGLALDGASRLVVEQTPRHLRPSGTAALLASWVHVAGEDWRERVAGWLPEHGIEAWFVQRDVADPALYVGTWLRDSGLDPRAPEAGARAEAWLDYLDEHDVEGIGFGFVFLQRTDAPTSLLAEDLRHGFDDPLGPEALDYLQRAAWLRTHDLSRERFVIDPATSLEHLAAPGPEGWQRVRSSVRRGDGPRWAHEIDELGAALLAGLRADGLDLGELVDLLAIAHGVSATQLRPAALSLVESLVRHGLVRPAELVR